MKYDLLRWSGDLATENCAQVITLLRQLLTDETYVSVIVKEGPCCVPEVRVNQKLIAQGETDPFLTDGSGGFFFSDTCKVYSVSKGAYIRFNEKQVTIRQQNGIGQTIYWVFAVQSQ